MPPDEYASVGGGLKLKGAKIGKKKRRKEKTDLERNLGDGSGAGAVARRSEDERKKKSKSEEPTAGDEQVADGEDDAGPVVHKTEAERRHEERKRRRVCSFFPSPPLDTDG